MSQTSTFYLDNMPGAAFRNLLNTILAALSEQNAGASPPAQPVAGMIWLDTGQNPPVLRLRNDSNNAWLDMFTSQRPPSKAQVGLGNVPNYAATASLTDSSASRFLLAAAGKQLNDLKLNRNETATNASKLGGLPADQYARISGSYTNLRAQATTKGDVGLGNVANYDITSSLTSNNSSQYASAKAIYDLNRMKVNTTLTINGKPLTANINLTAASVGAATKGDVSEAVKSAMPAGTIIMWAGSISQIPAGWALCNGSGKTSTGIVIPDLRGRFILGAGGSYAQGATGGSFTQTTSGNGDHTHSISVYNTTLSTSQMPSHDHSYTAGSFDSYGGYNGGANWNIYNAARYGTPTIRVTRAGGSMPHNHAAGSSTAGHHSHTVDVRPPYYALCFIIKL